MTKYRIENLKVAKGLKADKLIEYGFTNNFKSFYYMFEVISSVQLYNGCILNETINITFENTISGIKLYSIIFLYERDMIEVKDYKDYFDGKVDYSMLDDDIKKGVKVAEGILQDLIDNKILEFKEKK